MFEELNLPNPGTPALGGGAATPETASAFETASKRDPTVQHGRANAPDTAVASVGREEPGGVGQQTVLIQPPLFSGDELAGEGTWQFGDLEPFSYDLIMIDPPWRFQNWSDKGQAKGPEPHYKTMSDDEIRALPVGDLAKRDCLVWLWATWPKADLAIECLTRRWGFEFVTGGAWNKKRWGTGYVWRSVCEPVFIGKAGEPKVHGASVPNLFAEPRRGHSEKPEIAYRLAEQMMPAARRADVFSRRTRPGWEACGDEIGLFDLPNPLGLSQPTLATAASSALVRPDSDKGEAS